MKAIIEGLPLDKLNPRNFGGMCSRETVVFRQDAEIDFEKGIDTVATTEAPAIVVDWERWEIVREILPMRYCDLTGDDEDPLLDAHSRISIEKVKGRAFNWEVNDKNLECKMFVSEAEPAIRTKIKERVIKRVSLGYATDKNETVEIPKKSEVTIDGDKYRNDYEDDIPMIVRTWWKKKELSLVPLGADEAAKIKRALETGIKADDPELQKTLNEIITNQKSLTEKINSIQGGSKMAEQNNNQTPPAKTPEELRMETANNIREVGKKYFGGKFKEKAEQYAWDIINGKSDMTVERFQGEMLTEVQNARGGNASEKGFLDLPKSDVEKYRFTEAARIMLEKGKAWMDAKPDSSREIECHHMLVKEFGEPRNGGMYIPIDARLRGLRDMEMLGLVNRAHSAGTNSEGGYTVATELRPDMLVEFLKRDLVLGRLGATILTGLSGNLDIPKILSTLTAQAVAENNAADASYLVFDHETIGPKSVSANTVYGRQWFYQSSLNVDTLLFKHLEYVKNDKVENLAFNGTGLGNEITGLLNEDGITDVDLSTVNFANILQPKTVVKKAKAFDGIFKWCVSPDVETKMQSTPLMAGQAVYLMDLITKKMVGFDSEWTNQIPVNNLLFGNWPSLYMMFWGVDELLVDPYTSSTSGQVRMTIFTMFNKFLQQEAAFNISSNVSIV